MRLATLTASIFLALSSFAAAQSYNTPQDLLEAFYAPYFDGEFAQDDTVYRSEALNALYRNDEEVTPEGEMGAIDFDPFVDGQDFDITEFEIGAPGIAGDYASVDVTFRNFGEPRSLSFELVNEDGWKIDDVVSNSPENAYRLSEMFAANAALYQ